MTIDNWLVLTLILITAYYAWQTRETVNELRAQRTLESKPILLARRLIIHDNKARGGKYSCINCTLENIGNGPAINIHVGIYDSERDKRVAISENFIDYLTINSETDDSHIHIKNSDLLRLSYQQDEKGKMSAEIKIRLHYDDIYEKTYFSERKFYLEKGEREFIPLLGSLELS